MTPIVRDVVLQAFNPYGLPNCAASGSMAGAAGDNTFLIDGSSRVLLIADRSGNSRENCLVLNGVAGNYASAPDSAAVSITGDIDLRVWVSLTDWTPSAQGQLLAKFAAAGTRSYAFSVDTNGTLVLNISSDGSAVITAVSTVATGTTDGVAKWVRATRASASGSVIFYTSDDGSTWTQLGTTVAATSGAIFDSAAAVEIGSHTSGTGQPASGKFFRAQIYNGIAGTLVFDANFSLPAKLAASFTESSANAATVTINTSGDFGARICGARDQYIGTTGKAPIFSTASGYNQALGDGSNDVMSSAPFSLAQPCTVYLVGSAPTWTNGDVLMDGKSAADTMELFQDTTTPQVSAYAGGTVGPVAQATVAAKHVIGAVFNGASSWIGVDSNPVVTGDAGAATANGVTLFATAAAASSANFALNEYLVFSVAHAPATFARVMAALKRSNGIP